MPDPVCNREALDSLSGLFDPAAWHRVYVDPDPIPARQLFQRVTDEVHRAALPLVKPGELWLDLGCGTGELCRRLTGCGARLLGVDHDPLMLQWARERVIPGLPVNLLAADAACLPCDGGSVNGVVAASLTGCLDDAGPLMSELSRILAPGGYAALSFTNGESVFLGLSGWCRQRSARLGGEHPCLGRFHRYRLDDTIRTAGRFGLHVVSVRHFNCFVDMMNRAFPPVRIARALEGLPVGAVHRRLCRNFVLLLRNGGEPASEGTTERSPGSAQAAEHG